MTLVARAVPPPEGQEPALTASMAFVRALVEEWRVVVSVPFVATVLAIALGFVLPPIYTGSVVFVPESRSGSQQRLSPGLVGLAGQLGFSVSAENAESPQLYASVAKSRSLLEALLADSFPNAAAGGKRERLLDILRVKGSSEAYRVNKGVKRLNKRISTSVDRQTNQVRLLVDTRDAALSAAVANRLVHHINDFNVGTRSSRARERRQFLEQRSRDAADSLHAAEEHLRVFLERNRQYSSWPQLQFEHDQLQRQVDIQQDIYLTLSRDLEEARVQEVNDTPVITVIDSAVVPVDQTSPRPFRMGAVAMVLGAVAGAFVALGRRYRAALEAARDPEYEALRGAWQRFRGQLRLRRGGG